MVHADQLSDPEILAFWSLSRYGSGRQEKGRKAKIKKVQISSLEEVASLCHLLPLLLTKPKGLMHDTPLGSWEIRKRKERKKEERERREKEEEKEEGALLLLCAAEGFQEKTLGVLPF